MTLSQALVANVKVRINLHNASEVCGERSPSGLHCTMPKHNVYECLHVAQDNGGAVLQVWSPELYRLTLEYPAIFATDYEINQNS